MTAPINRVPFLRTSRNYPEDLRQLMIEVTKTYTDVASAINTRTIGLFPTNRPAITGEAFYLPPTKEASNQNRDLRSQSLRQVYVFSDALLTIPHGINFNGVQAIKIIYGSFFDTNTGLWHTLPYVDVVNVTNQITVWLDKTNIIVTKGATTTVAITSGIIVVEWISNL